MRRSSRSRKRSRQSARPRRSSSERAQRANHSRQCDMCLMRARSEASTRMSEQQQAGGTAVATQQAVIEAKDVVAGYLPGVNILNGCSLVAYPGEMIGII